MSLVELLDAVVDWSTFSEFVDALVLDRQEAERLEDENPERYKYGGANGWQNGRISDFLECALACVDANQDREPVPKTPNWRLLAEFLYAGKIYE